MAIIKQTTKNRILESKPEELSVPSRLVSRYFWKQEEAGAIPYLLVSTNNGASYTLRLEGRLFLTFGSRYCLECGQPLPPNSYQALCDFCQESDYYKRRRCIFEGPGKPFNRECTAEEPACGNPYAAARCWNDYLVYIGRLGSIIKVGLTSANRSEGKFYRLLEQGLDEALVLDSFPSLQAALLAESKISDLFGFATRIHFTEKVEELTHNTGSSDFDSQALQQDLEGMYEGLEYHHITLEHPRNKLLSGETITTSYDFSEISGEIIYAQGNVLIVRSLIDSLHQELIAYNLSAFAGYQIIDPLEYYCSQRKNNSRSD
jgi:hypothetical protein